MINSSTLTHLRALKLNAFAEGLELQAGQPEALTLSFEERLALLVDREVQQVWRERIFPDGPPPEFEPDEPF